MEQLEIQERQISKNDIFARLTITLDKQSDAVKKYEKMVEVQLRLSPKIAKKSKDFGGLTAELSCDKAHRFFIWFSPQNLEKFNKTNKDEIARNLIQILVDNADEITAKLDAGITNMELDYFQRRKAYAHNLKK